MGEMNAEFLAELRAAAELHEQALDAAQKAAFDALQESSRRSQDLQYDLYYLARDDDEYAELLRMAGEAIDRGELELMRGDSAVPVRDSGRLTGIRVIRGDAVEQPAL